MSRRVVVCSFAFVESVCICRSVYSVVVCMLSYRVDGFPRMDSSSLLTRISSGRRNATFEVSGDEDRVAVAKARFERHQHCTLRTGGNHDALDGISNIGAAGG